MPFLEYGALGVLAALMFFAYRNLAKQARDDRKYIEERQIQLIKDYNAACYATRDALIENTKIQTELFTWLKAKNGH